MKLAPGAPKGPKIWNKNARFYLSGCETQNGVSVNIFSLRTVVDLLVSLPSRDSDSETVYLLLSLCKGDSEPELGLGGIQILIPSNLLPILPRYTVLP